MSLADCDPISTDTLETPETTLTVANVVFDDTTVTQPQSGGYDIVLPAIKATWDASTNPYVIGLQFEYTPTSFAGQTKTTSTQPVAALSWVSTDGVVPEGVYDCRWRAVGISNILGDWSTPVSVTIAAAFSGLAGADGVLTSSDLYVFLWSIRPNLLRFDAWTTLNGAAAVDPFTDPPVAGAFGDQQAAYTIPGGSANVFLRRSGATYGLATKDGAAYNFSFKAKVDSGTAIVKVRMVDSGGSAITGVSDQTFNLTTTATTFTWSGIASDDTDFTSARIEIFTGAGTDIPSGRTVYVTELMLQNDNYGALHGMETPWRPSPDEDNLLRYAAILTSLFNAQIAAKPSATVRTDPSGQALEYVPPGPTKIVTDTTTTRNLSLADVGAYVRFTSSSAVTVNVPPASSVAWKPPGVITLSQRGTGAVTVVAGSGVTINPKLGGSLVLGGQHDVVQLIYAGSDTWDMI